MTIVAALVCGCGSSSDQGGCSGSDCQTFAVCPAGIQPTFDSINTSVFAKSCALSECHGAANAINAGGLDLETDPYTALLGTDGMGAPGNNIPGTMRNPRPPAPPVLRRVVPGDPDASYLVIKLSTTARADPKYGSGMPYTAPGSVCPETLKAVRDWIQAGAKK